MFKKVILGFVITMSCSTMVFAQADGISLADKPNLESDPDYKDGVQALTDGIHGALSTLEWTDASGPKLFRFGINLYSGIGSVKAQPKIGINNDAFMPSLGVQVNVGTLGGEVYVRFFPKINLSGVKSGSFGVGAKYDITNLIPIPGIPAVSAYASYHKFDFGVSGSKTVTYEDDVLIDNQTRHFIATYNAEAAVDISASSFNVGVVTGYSFAVLSVFGRVGLEFGKSSLDWNGQRPDLDNATYDQDTNTTNVPGKGFKGSQDFTNTGVRLGAGLSLLGFKAEVGYRSGMYLGAGWGFTI